MLKLMSLQHSKLEGVRLCSLLTGLNAEPVHRDFSSERSPPNSPVEMKAFDLALSAASHISTIGESISRNLLVTN